MKKIYLPEIRKRNFFLYIFQSICTAVAINLNNTYGGGAFHINIDDAHQGMKLGPKLLDALAQKLKETGYDHMWLVTQNRKTRGYGFYMHYGFREVKRYFLGSLALVYDIKPDKE